MGPCGHWLFERKYRDKISQKAVSTALPTEKRIPIDMALLLQGLSRGEYGLVRMGLSSILAKPLTNGARGISPTNVGQASFAERFRDELYASRHCSNPYQNLSGCEQVLVIFYRRKNAVIQLSL
jgi:hypothetical protein